MLSQTNHSPDFKCPVCDVGLEVESTYEEYGEIMGDYIETCPNCRSKLKIYAQRTTEYFVQILERI